MQTVAQSRQVRPRTAKVYSLEQYARYARQGHPALLWRAGLLPAEPVNENGPISNLNAGGKYYVDASGTVRFAAAGASYVHHIHNGTLWVPRGVLLESARTNVLTDPFNVSAAGWTPNGLNARSGPTTYAGMSFYKLEESTANSTHRILQAWTFANTTAAAKFYLKAGERIWVAVAVTATALRSAYINLSTGAVGTLSNLTSSQVVVNKLADDVWEVSLNGITGLTAGVGTIQVINATGDGASTTYAGTLGSGIYVGPVALVDGRSEVGSLIPSAGSRTADAASISSAFLTAIMPAGETTIRYTPNAATSAVERCLFDVTDASANGFRIRILIAGYIQVTVNGASTLTAVQTFAAGTSTDIKVAWSGTTWNIYRDGVLLKTDTLAALVTIGATAYLGSTRTGVQLADGPVELIEAVAA